MAAYAPAVAQIRVDSKTNEHEVALRLLGILPLGGKVVVGDAMFCQRDSAEKVVESGGDSLLVVKDNQEALKVDIQAGFAYEDAARGLAAATSPEDVPGSPAPDRVAATWDTGHGRIEKRTLETTPILTVGQKWKGLRQGFRITRERTVQGKKSVEVAYGITSLSVTRANAATLLALLRNHWRIENGLHYVRDETLGEDRCRVRKGGSAQALAALRNAAPHLMHDAGESNRRAATERFQIRPDDAIDLIHTRQCET